MKDKWTKIIKEFDVYDLPNETVFCSSEIQSDRYLVIIKSSLHHVDKKHSVVLDTLRKDSHSIYSQFQPEDLRFHSMYNEETKNLKGPVRYSFFFSEFQTSKALLRPFLEQNSSNGYPVHIYGLLGAIRFTEEYYAVVIIARQLAVTLGQRNIYTVQNVKLLPLFPIKNEISPLESKYVQLCENLFTSMPKAFYFSFKWDLTKTLQQQITSPTLDLFSKPVNLDETSVFHESRYVFNANILHPFLKSSQAPYNWIVPIIQGAVLQKQIKCGLRSFDLTVIARRSRFHVGPRFFKRGINKQGRVANEVECEQILWETEPANININDKDVTLLGVSSVVAVRGSIPLFWGHTNFKSIKPEIVVYKEKNLTYSKTQTHFQDLFERYGSPVIVLNMVKQKPETDMESKLSKEFEEAIEHISTSFKYHKDSSIQYSCASSRNIMESNSQDSLTGSPLSQSKSEFSEIVENISFNRRLMSKELITTHFEEPEPTYREILYYKYDWLNNVSEKGFHESLAELSLKARNCIKKTRLFFQCYQLNDKTGDWGLTRDSDFPRLYQSGVTRVNCVDCLDRTNLGMLSLGKQALLVSLSLLGCFSSINMIELPIDLMQNLVDIWNNVGDLISVSYAGSAVLHKAVINPYYDSYINNFLFPCSSTTPNIDNEDENSMENLIKDLVGNRRTTQNLLNSEYLIKLRSKYGFNNMISQPAWRASSTWNIITAIQRHLHGILNDLDKQRGFDLILKKYLIDVHGLSIWDFDVFNSQRNELLDKSSRCWTCYSETQLDRSNLNIHALKQFSDKEDDQCLINKNSFNSD